jgi:hypothetical protein
MGPLAFPPDFRRRVFVVGFLIRLATTGFSSLWSLSEIPCLVQKPTEAIPGRKKREALEGERVKPVKRFRDKQG